MDLCVHDLRCLEIWLRERGKPKWAGVAGKGVAEIERLIAALKVANKNHEHFEREWYLRGDEIERLQAENKMVHARMDWTIADNARKAIELADLQEEVKRLRKIEAAAIPVARWLMLTEGGIVDSSVADNLIAVMPNLRERSGNEV